jgi:hypothetical protein
MSCEYNSNDTIEISEGVDIVTELVEKIDGLRSKFKGISFKYNVNKNQHNFIDEVYFFAPVPGSIRDPEIGSKIMLNLPIVKVYRTLIPGIHDSNRDTLMNIIIQHDCEYTRNGKTVQESQYEIQFKSSTYMR